MSEQKKAQLREGEELIWTGSPCEEKEYGRADWVLVPVSTLLLALSALYATLTVHAVLRVGFSAAHGIALLLALALCGVSIYAYFLRFAYKRRVKADLSYGVTNQHRVLVRDAAEERLYVFEGEELRRAFISEADRCGIGTIYLRPKRFGNFFDNTGLEFLGAKNGTRIAMYDIPNCEKVLRLIQRGA